MLLAVAFLVGSITEIIAQHSLVSGPAPDECERSTAPWSRPLHPIRAPLSCSQHVDNELFQSGFQDDPFRLVGISRVYLAPGTGKEIEARQDLGGTSRFTIAPEEVQRLLNQNQLTVLDVGTLTPQDMTASYAATLSQEIAQLHQKFRRRRQRCCTRPNLDRSGTK